MTGLKTVACAVALPVLLSTSFLLAQTSTTPGSTPPQETPGQTNRVHTKPCWQQAGVPQSVEQQRRQIEKKIHAEMESVCNDSSLSAQQKREKIRQLHEQARQQVEALLSPQQKEAVQSCREREHTGRPEHGGQGMGGHGMQGAGGGGPCGKISSGKSAQPMPKPGAEPQ